MFKLDLSSIITMFFSFSMILLLYFYFKKRLDLTENKVDIMFNLIQEHQKQIKMQQLGGGACNIGCDDGGCGLPFSSQKFNCDFLNKDDNEDSETDQDSDLDENHESEQESEQDGDSDESEDSNNDEQDETDNISKNDNLNQDNLESNDFDIDESVVIPETNLTEESVETNISDAADIIVNKTDANSQEVVVSNENQWIEDKKSENLTILHDSNNNKIEISIVQNVESDIDYNKMKVSELKKIANERGIVGY